MHKANTERGRSVNPQAGKPALQAQFFPLSAVEKMQGVAKPDHDPKASAKLFHAFAAAGKELSDLHVNYESAREYKLKRTENKDATLDYRVEAMKLGKDKASLFYNDLLTLSGTRPKSSITASAHCAGRSDVGRPVRVLGSRRGSDRRGNQGRPSVMRTEMKPNSRSGEMNSNVEPKLKK